MASISPEQLKVLEQTRQRLVQLTQSLASLINNINQSDPLPSWSSLQSQATIISNNLLNVSEQLTDHHDLLSSLVAYPTPQFPGRTEASMLSQLLRTKLEPRVEDWVSQGLSMGNADATRRRTGLTAEQLAELWQWAPVEANMEARKRNWGGDYTREEKEMGVKNVVTGLKRRLNEEDSGSESGSGDEDEGGKGEEGGGDGSGMQVVGVHRRAGAGGVQFDISSGGGQVPPVPMSPALPLQDVFRFMMTGASPKGR
ncbi:RNA polymerase II mediator complex component Med8 [Blastomyces gilchristii SLH14081]|uniref:Mediator of RNA polymerase II transcription subunit 8 n=1 Tax=Blastomyces gilchristii (strain SLH14081) TaxID=559298 RepID=A0A179UDZ5_BLAGS|nr:RNA polymerase II mediator complex component Med8 [Blastomyces gilchristii SLH14081]OAT06194.1 RNA polymerase II mediator complex component Med8 [Blastomyces gilchristii SLH14081]